MSLVTWTLYGGLAASLLLYRKVVVEEDRVLAGMHHAATQTVALENKLGGEPLAHTQSGEHRESVVTTIPNRQKKASAESAADGSLRAAKTSLFERGVPHSVLSLFNHDVDEAAAAAAAKESVFVKLRGAYERGESVAPFVEDAVRSIAERFGGGGK